MYEGKEIVLRVNYKDFDCVVAGCEYDIGITIVLKDDKEELMHCLVNPDIAYKKQILSSGADEVAQLFEYYNKAYEKYLGYIQDGFWDDDKKDDNATGHGGFGIPTNRCAFR